MAYIPKGNSAWLLRKAINRSDSAIADLETNLTTLARTASNTGTSTTTQVLFNDAGIVNGDAGLVYNKTTDALSVGGALNVTGTSTLTGAATVQGLTLGKGASAVSTNAGFGNSVLAAVTTATNCNAFGNQALVLLQSGDRNTAMGSFSLASCTTGTENTAIGVNCLLGVVSGLDNTGLGDNAAYQATGSYNTSIGRSSLPALLGGASNTAVGYTAGSTQTSGSNNGFFGAGSTGDSNTADNSYNYGNGSVATHKFRAGDVVVGTGNVVMSTIGKGIDFSATANSSGNLQTSELLADYEEGTWVPVDASGASPALVFTVSECKYTKIGRAVTIQGVITYPSTVTTNGARFIGLPFAFVGMAPFNISYAANVATTSNLGFLIAHFSAGPLFYIITGAQTQNAMLSGSTIWFNGTYMI